MGTDLHNRLRSLCFNTDWKYAVFWKLKHRARMVLTWDDAYYESCVQHDPLENKCFRETIESWCGGHHSHDPLGLAVAKMSYNVYSLGEGVVGRVAVTGKHQWIIADKHVTNSVSSFEFSDGWQSQFSAGIRTIVVVAVVPYGVVQLGSFNKVAEDMKLVAHIQDVFLSLQYPSRHVTIPPQYCMNSSLYLPDLPAKGLDSGLDIIPDGLFKLGKASDKEGLNFHLPMFPYLPKHQDNSYLCSLPGINQNRGVAATTRHGGCGISLPMNDENVNLLQLRSNILHLGQQNQVGKNLVGSHMFGGKTSNWTDLSGGSGSNLISHINHSITDDISLCDVMLPSENCGADLVYFPEPKSDGVDINYLNRVWNMPESLNMNFEKVMEKELGYQGESSNLDTSNTFLKFSAGHELHEALGPAFSKGCMDFDCETEKSDLRNIIEVTDSVSHMTIDSASENLLEAVVGNVCHSGTDMKSEKLMQSMITTEKTPGVSSQSKNIVNSAGYLISQQSVIHDDTQNCSSSISSKGFSSTCPSTCIDQLDRRPVPAKNSKRRARPGENCRPRPRDRQLIQDRIKELRELVPNGAKCSIDSLLERSIKHLLFLECITKHADKLSKCAESKMHQKGADTSNYEKGSSWAVEVGGHLKVSTIIVENLNKNGHMLVEMLCEECSHFLEIAEAIRSLGLTILKWMTQMHGDKTWVCFIVEEQNNRVMHRMDILWSLVQILQPKGSN